MTSSLPESYEWLTDTLTAVGELVGAAEIQALFGVSRQRVQQLVSRADFPAPLVTLKAGKIWRTEDVVAWARARGRGIVQEEGAS